MSMFNFFHVPTKEDCSRAKFIVKIMKDRHFDVTTDFIGQYVDRLVIQEILTGDVVGFGNFSSAKVLCDTMGDELQRCVNVIKSSGVLLDNKATLTKIASPAAVLVLKTKKQWSRFFRYKKRTMKVGNFDKNWRLYISYLVDLFDSLNVDIPKVVQEEIVHSGFYYYCLEQGAARNIGRVNVHALTCLIKALDDSGLLVRNMNYIGVYFLVGGTYFPENPEVLLELEKILLEEPAMLEKYLRNISNANLPRGFGLFRLIRISYFRTNGYGICKKFFGDDFQLPMPDELHHMAHKDLEYLIKSMFWDDAVYDVNCLSVLLDVYLDDIEQEAFQKMVVEHSWVAQFESLISSGSKVPLNDLSIFSKILGRYPSKRLQDTFIRRGGDPNTIEDTGIADYANICYSIDGIRTILDYSTDEHIEKLLEDATFVDGLIQNVDSKSVSSGILSQPQLLRLIRICIDGPKSSYKIDVFTKRIIQKFSFNFLAKEIPEVVQYITSFCGDIPDYVHLTQLIRSNPKVVQYIPIQLLTKDDVMNYTREGTYKKLNISGVPMDYVVPLDQLEYIITQHNAFGYIADLSPEAAQKILMKLIEKDTRPSYGDML